MRSAVLLLLFLAAAGAAAPAEKAVDPAAELQRLKRLVPRFTVVDLPAEGSLNVNAASTLTIEDLRGVALDDEAPVVNPKHAERLTGPNAPFEAKGIRPFRMKWFTVEFNWSGWPQFCHTQNLYASYHGFNVLFHHEEPTGQLRRIHWGTFPNWGAFFKERKLAWPQFQLLAGRDVAAELASQTWKKQDDNTIAMVDLEHDRALSRDDLRKQPFYPREADAAARDRFESDYYAGYVTTHAAPVEALREAGWKTVGIYPQLFTITWYPMLGWFERDKFTTGIADPMQDGYWKDVCAPIAAACDVLYPDHYVFYWEAGNVAYNLAQCDHGLVYARAAGKPYRPYFWPNLHGGDSNKHWWTQIALPTEDERARYLLTCFTGVDGMVLWNFSDHDENGPRRVILNDGKLANEVFQVGTAFARPAADGKEVRFERYDAVSITARDAKAGTVTFQRIDTVAFTGKDFKPGPATSNVTMPLSELQPLLRRPTEAVAGAVEGLALAKPFERILRAGEVRIDVPAIRQFAKTEPIVRHVQLGKVHVLATYDPICVYRRAANGRPITLADFNGVKGRTVVLPADGNVRVVVLKEP